MRKIQVVIWKGIKTGRNAVDETKMYKQVERLRDRHFKENEIVDTKFGPFHVDIFIKNVDEKRRMKFIQEVCSLSPSYAVREEKVKM